MTEPAVKQWYIARDGKQTGPISDVEINTIAGMGYFRATDLVWRPGLAEWQPALNLFPPQGPQAPAGQAAPFQAPRTAPQPAPSVAREFDTTRPSQSLRPRAPDPFQPSPLQARPLSIETPASQRSGAEQSQRSGAEHSQRRDAEQSQRSGAEHSQRRDAEHSQRRDAEHSQRRAAEQAQRTGAATSQRGDFERSSFAVPSGEQRMPRDTRRESTARTAPPAGSRGSARDGAKSSSRGAIAFLAILVIAITGGVWLMAHPGLQQNASAYIATLVQPKSGAEPAPDRTAKPADVAASAPVSGPQLAEIDERLQHSAHWPVLKRVFPDWYGDRLREAAKLTLEQRSDDDITKALVDQIVALRRQNVSQALSASGPKLKAMASAFLENLKQLKAQSTTTCYNFISRGETTPGVVNLLRAGTGTPPLLQFQIAAIFEAIDEGRATPVTHQRPQKSDFDFLMGELAKLGWTQADVAVFADPDKLAKAEPERVCQMVQDWFVAHIGISDPGIQERLLSETLRPVVAG